jgi:hypothetical protein
MPIAKEIKTDKNPINPIMLPEAKSWRISEFTIRFIA